MKFFFVFGVLLFVECCCGETATATTTCGAVFGNALPCGADEFLGIKFATSERFQPSVLRTKPFSKREQDATYYGQACLQTLTSNTTYGVEDCLVINVWTPHSREGDELLPVNVYIYGGSNDFGEAEPYNASILAVNHDVVVASFNYRVGPFGFLAFEEQIEQNQTTGNFALTDMVTALEWISREIANFGGDKNRVAIFGQSSGAGAVELLTITPRSKGLFRGAISQSGGLSASSLSSSLDTTKEMHKRLNCTTRNFTSTLACLQSSKGDAIVFAQAVECTTPNVCSGLSFGPTVDFVYIPDNPRKLVEEGKFHDVSILFGANNDDANLFVLSSYDHVVNATEYVHILNASLPNHKRNELQTALRLYPVKTNHSENHVDLIGRFSSDRTLCGVRSTVKAYAKSSRDFSKKSGSFFAYRFDWWFQSNSTCTAVANYHNKRFGSMHQDEVSFVFGQPIFMNIGYSNCSQSGWAGYSPTCLGCRFDAKEAAFAKTVGTFWTNLAASGDPNKRDNHSQDVVWPQVTDKDQNIVLRPDRVPFSPATMAVEVAMGRPDACRFWDGEL